MRILFTRFPYASAKGGAENQTKWLMEGLRARGHQLQFLGSCPVLLARARELKIDNEQLIIGPPPVTKWHAISFLWRKKTMKQKLIAAVEALPEPPEVLMMLSLSEKILLSEWAASRGIRVFWIEHDRIGNWLIKNPWFGALKKAAQQATIICVSELSRKLYVDVGFESARVVAIPNGVPASSPGPFSLREKGGLRLGCIARLSEEKGIDVLIQAISDLPECDLTIVGKGPQEGYVRSLITEDTTRLGIGMPRISLELSVPDLDVLYASLDALVLPSSDHDPFGLVAAEAMVRGIPTIVTDACGIAGYLVEGEQALIAKAGSAPSLREKITKLFSSELRSRLSEAGTKAAIERFSLKRMVDDYESIIQHDFR